MNKFSCFLLSIMLTIFISCDQKSKTINYTKNRDRIPQNVSYDSIFNKEFRKSDDNNLETKYLITNHAVGLFKTGGSWRQVATDVYNYEFIQHYGKCIDFCCDGGFNLGINLIIEYGYATNPEITIGASLFREVVSCDDEYETNKYVNNKDLFLSVSDNCCGWYWNDKIAYIIVHSDLFKTKEGIGVGTTLVEAEEKLKKIRFNVGWINEDINALEFRSEIYPSISFILDYDDYSGNWEDINFAGEDNTLTVSDFKKDTKIKRLIVH